MARGQARLERSGGVVDAAGVVGGGDAVLGDDHRHAAGDPGACSRRAIAERLRVVLPAGQGAFGVVGPRGRVAVRADAGASVGLHADPVVAARGLEEDVLARVGVRGACRLGPGRGLVAPGWRWSSRPATWPRPCRMLDGAPVARCGPGSGRRCAAWSGRGERPRRAVPRCAGSRASVIDRDHVGLVDRARPTDAVRGSARPLARTGRTGRRRRARPAAALGEPPRQR